MARAAPKRMGRRSRASGHLGLRAFRVQGFWGLRSLGFFGAFGFRAFWGLRRVGFLGFLGLGVLVLRLSGLLAFRGSRIRVGTAKHPSY